MNQIEETKYALESLYAEFGQTLPSDFMNRMMRIGKPYIYGAFVNGIYYNGRSYVFDQFETITYHATHGSSIEEIKNEMEQFIHDIYELNEMIYYNEEKL